MTKDAVMTGKILILNVDDSETKYSEHYDPNVKEYYGAGGFSPLLWRPNDLIENGGWETVLNWKEEEEQNLNLEDYHVSI